MNGTLRYEATFAAHLVLALAIAILSGCQCTAIVTMSNRTSTDLHVRLSLPYPAYQPFTNHCQYRFLLGVGDVWRSSSGARRANLPMARIHGGVVMQLSDAPDHSEYRVFWAQVTDYGDVEITGAWPDIFVRVLARRGDEIPSRAADDEIWFRHGLAR